MDSRKTSDKRADEMETFLVNGLPTQNVVAILKNEKRDEKEINAFIEKYEASRHRIKKLIKKFADKIETKYKKPPKNKTKKTK